MNECGYVGWKIGAEGVFIFSHVSTITIVSGKLTGFTINAAPRILIPVFLLNSFQNFHRTERYTSYMILQTDTTVLKKKGFKSLRKLHNFFRNNKFKVLKFNSCIFSAVSCTNPLQRRVF